MLEFDRSAELIELGYHAAKHALAAAEPCG
jgi:hypothetical protein